MSKKTTPKPPKQRNWIAVHAFQRSGSGAHKSKARYSRKSKHKNIQQEH